MDILRRVSQAGAIAIFAILTPLPTPCWALDTYVRLHSSPGANPANIHLEVAPAPGALTVQTTSSPAGARVTFTGSGPSWTFEFAAPYGIPFGVGSYDTTSYGFEYREQARFHLIYNNSYTTTPYGSFEVREARRDAQGKLASLWVTFLYRSSKPGGPPLVGEIRWNADTTLYLRCPRRVITAFGEPTTFEVEGVDTRGRPVTLSAASLPAGVSFTPTTPGKATVHWPAAPAIEQTYPIRFTAVNDEGLQDTATTYVTVARSLWVDIMGDATDPVSRGVHLTATEKNSTIYSSVASDSTFALDVYSGYHASSWVLRPPTGHSLRTGTYSGYRMGELATPTESAVHITLDGRTCSTVRDGTLRLREYRVGADFRVVSLWAELEQACVGSTGVMRTEIRYNCNATLDVQAPAVVSAGVGEPVRFDVTTRSLSVTPPTLTALTLPSGATFLDRGDGTGEFSWIDSAAPGKVALASFVATESSGARDTVTTRIQSRAPFQVRLAGVPGDFLWTGTPYLYDASNSTLTLAEGADSTLIVGISGLGHRWEFAFSAAAGRGLTTGVYDPTVPDVGRAVSAPRLRGSRDGLFSCSNDSRFHVRKLARTPTGAIRSFWATFSIACAPGATPQVGEVRYDADTSLYVSAPNEIVRRVGQPVGFNVVATEASGTPAHLSMLAGPTDAIFADHGDGTASFDWPSGAIAPGLTRVVLRTESDAGASDTAVVVLRANALARFDAWSAPGDPVAQGIGESRNQDNAIFAVRKLANGGVSASVATPSNLWTLAVRAGGGNKPLTTGVYTGARTCGNCNLPATTPALDVTKDGRTCPSSIVGSFDVRKLRIAPDGSVRSYWIRFDQSCVGSLSGDLRYDVDTSIYLRTPAYATTEVGRAVSLTVSAVETRGLAMTITAPQLPAGSMLVDHGDGTATLEWPSGAPEVGLFPITWVATSSDGAADTSSTTLESFRSALFAVQSTSTDPVGAGLALRLTGADGAVTTTSLGDSALRVTFDGSGHFFEYYLQSPWGRSLREGMFTGGRRYLANQWNEPGLHVKLDGRLCDLDAGDFHVRRLRRSPSGAVASLWVVFSQSCTSSPTVMTGEIRVMADTSVYIEAPAEVARLVGDHVVFPVRAVDTRGLPTTLTAVELPAGADFITSGPAAGELTWAASDTAGSVARFAFVAVSQDGATDTVITLVRTFARAFLKMSSAPGDYLGQGKEYDLRPTTGAFRVTRTGTELEVRWIGKLDIWSIRVNVPVGRLPAIGRYDGALSNIHRGPMRPGLDVSTTGRGCGSAAGQFQIRRIELGPDDRVHALWMTFEVACNTGLFGEIWFAADSSYWLDGPADLYPDPDQVLTYDIRARGTLEADASWSLVASPPGTTLAVTGIGTVRIDTRAPIAPGDYPITLMATGSAGSGSLTTFIHVPQPSFVSIQSTPNYLFPLGISRRFLDRDGTLQFWRNPNNSLSMRFNGSARRFEMDFSRANGQRIVPGDYIVTGPIAPVGTSPNGLHLVWGGSVPTLTTGVFHVIEATYGANDELRSLWLTWEMNGPSLSSPLSGEIHMFAPDHPTPVELSLVDSRWTGHANLIRWHATGHGGARYTAEREVGDGPWERLFEVTPDGSGYIVLEDREVVRGLRHGYRLVATHDRRVLLGEAWVDVPGAVTLGIQRVGSNPGPAPIQYEIAMPARGPADLDLVDVAGRVLDHRRWPDLSEGRHLVRYEGPELAPGLYLARLRAHGRLLTRSIIVLR